MRQRTKVAAALANDPSILILDEPTAVLTPQETEELFEIMHSLVSQGKSIIFITHKLDEVMSFADRVMVLRAGRVVATLPIGEATKDGLARLMVAGATVMVTLLALALFSWPSTGTAIRYAEDETNLRWSVPHIEAFVRGLNDRQREAVTAPAKPTLVIAGAPAGPDMRSQPHRHPSSGTAGRRHLVGAPWTRTDVPVRCSS